MSGEENRAGDDSVIGGDDPTTVGDEEVGDDTPESAQNLLDALVSALLIPVDIAVEGFRAITLDPVDVLDIFRTGGDIGGVLGQTLEEVTPADEAAGVVVDTAEELVISPLQQQGEITPGNVEGLQDDLEGNASALLLGIVLLTLNIEAATGGQFEEVPAELFGIVTALGFDDVTGREIDARLNEGVDPALKQKVHSEHRSKQADFQDYIEASLRTKGTDDGVNARDFPDDSNIEDLLHPKDLGFSSDLSTYGTRPGQDKLFELDALAVSEPEEIIEEPIQYGIPVPKRPVEQLGELQGFPEDVKEIYLSVIEKLPQNENLLQDYVRLTEFNFRLREKVQAGVLTPEDARDLIKPELEDLIDNAIPEDRLRPGEDRTADETVTELADELLANFELLQSLPSDPPTAGDIQSFYRKGVINSDEFMSLYKQFGRGNGRAGQYLREQTIDKGAETIRRQATLGRITDSEATTQLQRIGFSTSEATAILDGSNPDDIVANRVQDRAQTDALPVELAVNIGDVRGQRLRLAGIETLQDLQNVDVTEVTAVTGVNDQIAQEAINSASILLTEAATQESS
jgi:hypothetical protein